MKQIREIIVGFLVISMVLGNWMIPPTTTAYGAQTKASVTKKITALEKQITKLQKTNGSTRTIQAKQKKLKTYRDALKDKVVFSTKRIYLYEEETYKVKYSFQKQTASVNSVKWSVDNKQVATVSAKGVVTGRKEGSCYLTATAGVSGKKAKVKVIVSKDDQLRSVKFVRNSAQIDMENHSVLLDFTYNSSYNGIFEDLDAEYDVSYYYCPKGTSMDYYYSGKMTLTEEHDDWDSPPIVRAEIVSAKDGKGTVRYYLSNRTIAAYRDGEKLALEFWIGQYQTKVEDTYSLKLFNSNMEMTVKKFLDYSENITLNDHVTEDVPLTFSNMKVEYVLHDERGDDSGSIYYDYQDETYHRVVHDTQGGKDQTMVFVRLDPDLQDDMVYLKESSDGNWQQVMDEWPPTSYEEWRSIYTTKMYEFDDDAFAQYEITRTTDGYRFCKTVKFNGERQEDVVLLNQDKFITKSTKTWYDQSGNKTDWEIMTYSYDVETPKEVEELKQAKANAGEVSYVWFIHVHADGTTGGSSSSANHFYKGMDGFVVDKCEKVPIYKDEALTQEITFEEMKQMDLQNIYLRQQ